MKVEIEERVTVAITSMDEVRIKVFTNFEDSIGTEIPTQYLVTMPISTAREMSKQLGSAVLMTEQIQNHQLSWSNPDNDGTAVR